MNKKINVNMIFYVGDCANEFPNNIECITTKDFSIWLEDHNKARLIDGEVKESPNNFLVINRSMEL